MKRSEFVDGVVFEMPQPIRQRPRISSLFRLEVLNDTVQVVYKHGWIRDDRFIKCEADEYWHVDFKPKGLQLWTPADTVYLRSNVIPFESLRKVDLPEPATNPISI